jgi:hypothetical protein
VWLCGVPVHSGTARFSAGPYTCSMQLESIEATVANVWVSAVCTAGIAGDLRSLSGWTVLSDLAVLPPLAMMSRWNSPRQSMSESIQEALQ